MDFIINLLVSAALVGLVFLYFNNKIRKALDAQNLLTEVRQEVAALVRDLNQTTDRNLSLIEAKILDLEKLLASADQKMLLLAKEDAKQQTAKTVYSHLARQKPLPAAEPELAETPPASDEVIAFPPAASRKKTAAPAPDQPRQAGLFGEEPGPAKPAEKPAEKPLKERVLELAAQGFSGNIIAVQTGASLAEVDLILSMNRGKW